MKITFESYTMAQTCLETMTKVEVNWFGELYECSSCRHSLGMIGFFCIECVEWEEE